MKKMNNTSETNNASRTNNRNKIKKTIRMGKKLALVMAVTLLIMAALTGCGRNGGSGTDGVHDELPTIGIVSISDHTSLTMIREAIITQLAADGYVDGETVNIDYQSAQGEPSNLKPICQKFTSKGYDLIIAIATPSAQIALGETTDTPIVFSAVTDPIDAGLVTSMTEPGGNITGTSDAVSASKIMELAKQLTPGMKTVGALYCTSEANSLAVIKELKEYAKKNDLTIVDAPVMNASEIKDAASSLVGKVDAVFSPIDNVIANAMPASTQVLDEAKLPFYVSADSMVMDGGFATYGINYVSLGTETGKMVTEILKGANPGVLDVKTINDVKIYINTDVAKRIGVDIPQNILDQAAVFTDANVGNQ